MKSKIKIVFNIALLKLTSIFIICGIESTYQTLTCGYFVLGKALIEWLVVEFIISTVDLYQIEIRKKDGSNEQI